jgi:hypothetical protein
LVEGVGVAEGVIQMTQSKFLEPLGEAKVTSGEDIERGDAERALVEVWMKLDFGTSAKRTTILKNLRKMSQVRPRDGHLFDNDSPLLGHPHLDSARGRSEWRASTCRCLCDSNSREPRANLQPRD